MIKALRVYLARPFLALAVHAVKETEYAYDNYPPGSFGSEIGNLWLALAEFWAEVAKAIDPSMLDDTIPPERG